MAEITLTQSRSIPYDYQIVKEYGAITGQGDDILAADQALLANANKKSKNINWILAVQFNEIPGSVASATGFAFNLATSEDNG